MTTQFDNLIKYTGRTGGFTYGATVGLGERSGSSREGRKLALGGSWFGDGLGVMASWERIDGTPIEGTATNGLDETTAYHVAVDYRSGPWRYTAGKRGYKLAQGRTNLADLRGDTYWGGITRTIDAVTLTGAVYHINTKNLPANLDADPTMFVARAMLALSKRTDLYLSLAHAKADNGQLIGLSRDDPGFGSTQSGITAGMQHRF
jgi:predicted porin